MPPPCAYSGADGTMSVVDLALHERLAAAAGASVVAAVVTNPLEVLKTRLQTQLAAPCHSETCQNAKWQSARPELQRHAHTGPTSEPPIIVRSSRRRPLSTVQVFRNLVQQEGITALWKGIRPALLAAAPTVGIYMPLYDTLRDKLQPSLGYATPLVAGATARTVAVFCVAPLEVLRTRLMASTGRPALAMVRSVPGTCICVAEVPELPPTPAARMWMRGLPATLLRDIPFTMIFWTITESIRGPILNSSNADTQQGKGSNSQTDTSRLLYANAAAASIAGGVAAVATTPFDVIKTQQQTGLVDQSVLATARSIVQRNGFGGLWAGVMPRLMRIAPSSAMVITTYEFLKQQILASHNSHLNC